MSMDELGPMLVPVFQRLLVVAVLAGVLGAMGFQLLCGFGIAFVSWLSGISERRDRIGKARKRAQVFDRAAARSWAEVHSLQAAQLAAQGSSESAASGLARACERVDAGREAGH